MLIPDCVKVIFNSYNIELYYNTTCAYIVLTRGGLVGNIYCENSNFFNPAIQRAFSISSVQLKKLIEFQITLTYFIFIKSILKSTNLWRNSCKMYIEPVCQQNICPSTAFVPSPTTCLASPFFACHFPIVAQKEIHEAREQWPDIKDPRSFFRYNLGKRAKWYVCKEFYLYWMQP